MRGPARSQRFIDQKSLHGNREPIVVHRGRKLPLVEKSLRIVPDLGHRVALRIDLSRRAHANRAKNRSAPRSPRRAASRRCRPTDRRRRSGPSTAWCNRRCISWARHAGRCPCALSANSGKRIGAPPALVAKLVLRRCRVVERLHDVPIAIRRFACRFRKIGKRKEIAARVVEHAVDDHANIPRACACFNSSRNSLSAAVHFQLAGSLVSAAIDLQIARRIGTEIRIDMMKRAAVVFVQRAWHRTPG